MSRGWRVLDATSFHGVVDGKRGAITLRADDGESTEVSLAEVGILLVGSRVALTGSALHYLAKYDVPVLNVDWRGVPVAGFHPWSDHGRVAARHLAQAALTLPRRKNAWMQLVRAKISGQAANLEKFQLKGAATLSRVAATVRSGDPNNSEAAAARLYWRRLFEDRGWPGRDRASEDHTNQMLNYGYMVLRGFGIRAVLAAGLSPPLGLFHHGRGNYFNLVDDLIEPFRPAIDARVWELPGYTSLNDPETKRALVAASTQPFADDGRGIPAVLEDLAQQLGKYVEGEIAKLIVPAWRGGSELAVVSDRTRGAPEDDDPPW